MVSAEVGRIFSDELVRNASNRSESLAVSGASAPVLTTRFVALLVTGVYRNGYIRRARADARATNTVWHS
jgi:hypothetical protein